MLKIYELKEYVYEITETKNTQELRKKHPELLKDKDLRKKCSWFSLYKSFKVLEDFSQEQREKDIQEKYGYKKLDSNCSVQDILNNLEATRKFAQDFEDDLETLEKKVNSHE